MKPKLIVLFASLTVLAPAEEASLSFASPGIELPQLSLSSVTKKAFPLFFREDSRADQSKQPPLNGVKKADPSVIVPRDDIDPKMLIAPNRSIDFKMRIIPSGQKR